VARAISEPSGQASIEYPVATTFIINNQILRPTQVNKSIFSLFLFLKFDCVPEKAEEMQT